VRILVTGAGGQLGSRLVQHLASRHDVLGMTHAQLDTSDRDAVERLVGEFGPEAIVDCAAMTNVDACESDTARAFAVNALGPRHLSVAAARVGAHVVGISTDYVFDGAKRAPYVEWDRTNPISVYGTSKLGGEEEVQRHAPSWSIVRTAWIFGRPGSDFVSWVLGLPRDRAQPVVDDQTGSPAFVGDLVPVVARLAVERHAGVFHVTNAGECTRFRMAADVLELAGRDPSLLKPITTAELGRPAPRPAYSVLRSHALSSLGVEPLRDYREALAEHVRAIGGAT
jgi:dTDP-4-dehydrorhamnose reductase